MQISHVHPAAAAGLFWYIMFVLFHRVLMLFFECHPDIFRAPPRTLRIYLLENVHVVVIKIVDSGATIKHVDFTTIIRFSSS